MILSCNASLGEVEQLQKKYPWGRPNECPRCQGKKIWGHGYVQRYFNSLKEGLFLKRWRCPKCSLILTCRPQSHWRRFQESISNIFVAIMFKIQGSRWPPWVPRQRGGYWLGKLIENARKNELIKNNLAATILFYKNKNLAIF